MSDDQKPLSPEARSLWEQLYNERNALWRKAEDKLDRVRQLLEFNGCDCVCGHGPEECDEDCDPCFACDINGAIQDE